MIPSRRNWPTTSVLYCKTFCIFSLYLRKFKSRLKAHLFWTVFGNIDLGRLQIYTDWHVFTWCNWLGGAANSITHLSRLFTSHLLANSLGMDQRQHLPRWLLQKVEKLCWGGGVPSSIASLQFAAVTREAGLSPLLQLIKLLLLFLEQSMMSCMEGLASKLIYSNSHYCSSSKLSFPSFSTDFWSSNQSCLVMGYNPACLCLPQGLPDFLVAAPEEEVLLPANEIQPWRFCGGGGGWLLGGSNSTWHGFSMLGDSILREGVPCKHMSARVLLGAFF